jgi:ribosomal-protein-alanine N-acetyltransferase
LFKDIPEISTTRLILRKIDRSDLKDLFVICSNSSVSDHTTWGTHVEEEMTEGYIEFLISQYEIGESADWGIEFNEKLVGMCSFVNWSVVDCSAELGYVIGQQYWRQGIVRESVNALLQYGFTTLELNRIEARCNDDNIASERVMQSVGMSYEGTLREDRFIKGIWRNTKVYSMLSKEFRRVEEGS